MLKRSERALPMLYLVWALPLLLALTWLIPPWSNPDEPNHMLRVVELAHGELIGQQLGPREAGGLSDASILEAGAAFQKLKFHPEQKVTQQMRAGADRVAWHGKLSVTEFGNTASYPPFLYLPAMAAVRIGQVVGLHVDHNLYLARAATVLAAVLVSTLALALARRTRYALAALAMLPMTCELDASVGQDALMIALTLLAVGWVDCIIERGRPPSMGELAGLALALAAVAMARPPYVTLALLPLLATARLSRSCAAAAAFVVVAVGAWSALAAWTVLVSWGDPSTQARLLLAHPLRSVGVFVSTLRFAGPAYAEEFVGRLGWLDTPLPRWYVVLALIVVAAGFLAAVGGASRRSWLPISAVIGGVVLVFVSQYFSWTQPGAATVDGVQGRYFIPLAAAAVLAMPTLLKLEPLVRPVALVGLGMLGVTTPFVMVQAMVVRYYLAGC